MTDIAIAPKLFKSTDTGAASMTGQVGKLTEVIASCLVIAKQFTGISGGSFVDNTTEARLEGGTTFKLFQGPTANNDEAYFGMCLKFEKLRLNFGTLGVQGSAVTLAWEYWNGSAWTAFTPDSDGTSGFTANGTVAWTISALTGWVTNSVNSTSMFWIRVRFTAGTWSTNPLVNYSTTGQWTVAYSGTNALAFHMAGGGTGFYLNVNDNGPGAGGAKEARMRGYETMSAIDTGTNPCPTTALSSAGIIVRKSASADGTARTWKLHCDHRTFRLFIISGDSANVYFPFEFGDFKSRVAGDVGNCWIIGRESENSGAINNIEHYASQCHIGATLSNHFMFRAYTQAAGAIRCGKHSDASGYFGQAVTFSGNVGGGSGVAGGLQGYMRNAFDSFNPEDGAVDVARIHLTEPTGSPTNYGHRRGRPRGLWHLSNDAIGDPTGAFADGQQYVGAGDASGKTFEIVKQLYAYFSNGSSGNLGMALEVSDTWE